MATSTALTLTVSSSVGWTNPNNALSSNNVYATNNDTTLTGTNSYFKFSTNASSLLPVGAYIVGVVVQVEYKVNTTAPLGRIAAGPGDFAGDAQNVLGTTTDVVYTFGSSTDSLGAVSRDDVALCTIKYGKNGSGNVTHSVDNITMTVYWDPSPPTSNKFNALFFGELF